MLNIEDAQVDNLANFMGHAKEIHKSIYRMPIPIKEMTDVSRLLEAAMGTDLDDNDNEDCDNNVSDTDSVSQMSTISEEIAQTNNYIPDSDNDNFDDNTTQHSSDNHTTNNSHSEHYNSESLAFRYTIFIYIICIYLVGFMCYIFHINFSNFKILIFYL